MSGIVEIADSWSFTQKARGDYNCESGAAGRFCRDIKAGESFWRTSGTSGAKVCITCYEQLLVPYQPLNPERLP